MATVDMMRSFLARKKELDEKEGTGTNCLGDYHSQFMVIKMEAMQYKQITPATVGLTPENISKNRYKDVIPYDESRVKLTPVDGAEGSDYINASYVNGVVKDHEYIAAMGPLASTADDFWRMVWQEKVYVIITACNEYEGCPKKKKCHRYWSQDVLDDVEFGDISIKLDEETQESPDFICRSLRVSRGGEERLLSQLHYLSWPDRSVPSSVESILNLITTMRQKQASRSGPILVHCSAGCGRTGTIIAVDYVWNLIKLAKLPEQFSLKALVLKMRKQRPAFVQAPEQYKFLHECVAELFLQHLSKVKGHTYENCVLNEDEADYANVDCESEEDDLYQEGASEGPTVTAEYSVAMRLPEDDTYSVPHKANLSNTRIKVVPKPVAEEVPPPIPQYMKATELDDGAYSYVSTARPGNDPLYEDISSMKSTVTQSSVSSDDSSSSSTKENASMTDLQKPNAVSSNMGRPFNALMKKMKTLKPNTSLSASTQDAIEEIFYKGRNISFGHRVDRVSGPRCFSSSSKS